MTDPKKFDGANRPVVNYSDKELLRIVKRTLRTGKEPSISEMDAMCRRLLVEFEELYGPRKPMTIEDAIAFVDREIARGMPEDRALEVAAFACERPIAEVVKAWRNPS